VSDFIFPDSLVELSSMLEAWVVREVLNALSSVNVLTRDTLNLIVRIWEMIDMLR